MEEVFVVMSTGSGEIFGGSYDAATAKEWAKSLGPDIQALSCERSPGGKWKIQGLQGGKSDDGVREERSHLLAKMADLGIGGLVYQAVAQGLTGKQARQLFNGQPESALWGPKGRPAEEASQEAVFTAQWNSSPAVQSSFGGNLEGFLAYKRAEAQGLITIIGGKGQG